MRPRSKRGIVLALCLPFLNGCATRPTVDDGRALNAEMVADMRASGDAAIALRPAIVRSVFAAYSGCDNQYALPFDAMTTYGIDDDDTRIAWLRALGLDERLVDARDRGEPCEITLDSGERVTVSPVRLCRGYVLIAPPLEPALQRYHRAKSVHPLKLFRHPLTPDEAEWIVLWTQGLSERGGARMKAYAFVVASAASRRERSARRTSGRSTGCSGWGWIHGRD